MLRIELSTVIYRPVETVWDFVNDLSNSPRWTASGSELRQTSDGPSRVGSTIESRRRLLGRFEIKSQTLVLTEYEPNRAVSYAADVAFIGRANARITFERTEDGTRLTRLTEGELGRGTRWLQPILDRVIRWGQGIEMANLKRLIEALPDQSHRDAERALSSPVAGL